MDSSTQDRSIAVRFTNVSRHFGTVRAVEGVSMEIYDGEFFSMLGPSGSGKTTCLRMIAGFEQPTSGSIRLHNKEIAGVPPFERDVNTVFQDYALFPHMTVGDNVGYGLMIRKVPKAEREKRVAAMLDLVRLPNMQKRKPSQLSGGQRQRVALARALINQPGVLLLDEPLGALDLKLRQEMQFELKQIQQQVGITFIYVTHDQEEALTMSDRIAIFSAGHLEQIGTPAEVYEQPASAFVAGFVGTSNLFTGDAARALSGSDQPFTVRPERIQMLPASAPTPPDSRTAQGVLKDVIYLGMNTRYLVELDSGASVIVIEQNRDSQHWAAHNSRGERILLAWALDSERPVQV